MTGDRFVPYTDGFSEPENAAGEAFADRRVDQILHDNSSRPAAEVSLLLLNEIRSWAPRWRLSQPAQQPLDGR